MKAWYEWRRHAPPRAQNRPNWSVRPRASRKADRTGPFVRPGRRRRGRQRRASAAAFRLMARPLRALNRRADRWEPALKGALEARGLFVSGGTSAVRRSPVAPACAAGRRSCGSIGGGLSRGRRVMNCAIDVNGALGAVGRRFDNAALAAVSNPACGSVSLCGRQRSHQLYVNASRVHHVGISAGSVADPGYRLVSEPRGIQLLQKCRQVADIESDVV